MLTVLYVGARIAAAISGIVLAVAGGAKLAGTNRGGFLADVLAAWPGVTSRLRPRLDLALSVLFCIVEIVTGTALLAGLAMPLAAGMALALFLVFAALVAGMLRHGRTNSCGCFGRLFGSIRLSRRVVWRNLALALLVVPAAAGLGASVLTLPATGPGKQVSAALLPAVCVVSMSWWLMRRLARR